MRPVDARQVEELIGAGVAVEVGVPGAVEGELYPEEEAMITRAVAKRRNEFVAGRVLARRALARIGAPRGPLVTNGGRAPVWPAGFTGSITHSRSFCVVAAGAVAPAGLQSVGLDVEEAVAVKDELTRKICTERDRVWLSSRPAADRGLLVKLVFCAKEAFYKCQHPLTGRFLDFSDVDLEIDLDRGAFRAHVDPEKDELPDALGLECRFCITEDLIVATARAESGP